MTQNYRSFYISRCLTPSDSCYHPSQSP